MDSARIWIGGTEETWLVVGDATFDDHQTENGEVAGVSENVGDARTTQGWLRSQVSDHTTTLLPAHDPVVFERLLKGSTP